MISENWSLLVWGSWSGSLQQIEVDLEKDIGMIVLLPQPSQAWHIYLLCVCVCVCVRERERERGGGGEGGRERDVQMESVCERGREREAGNNKASQG